MLIRVNEDGTLSHVTRSTVKLKETEVYIILDSTKKRVLLFSGENATVSHQFLGLKIGKKLKKELRYTLISGKNERETFNEALKKAKENIKKKKSPPKSVLKILDELNAKSEEAERAAHQEGLSLEDIMKEFDGNSYGEDLPRDYIITKEKVYAIGEDSTEGADLPSEGVFTADNYIPRVLIKNGEVIAIELLRRTR